MLFCINVKKIYICCDVKKYMYVCICVVCNVCVASAGCREGGCVGLQFGSVRVSSAGGRSALDFCDAKSLTYRALFYDDGGGTILRGARSI